MPIEQGECEDRSEGVDRAGRLWKEIESVGREQGE